MEEQLKKPPNNGGSSGSPSKLSSSQVGGNNNGGAPTVKVSSPSNNPSGLEETGQGHNSSHKLLEFNKDLEEEEKQQLNSVSSPSG